MELLHGYTDGTPRYPGHFGTLHYDPGPPQKKLHSTLYYAFPSALLAVQSIYRSNKMPESITFRGNRYIYFNCAPILRGMGKETDRQRQKETSDRIQKDTQAKREKYLVILTTFHRIIVVLKFQNIFYQ